MMEDSNNEHTVPTVKRWVVAVRPFAYTASVLAVVLGVVIAYDCGYPIHRGLFAVTLLGVLCFHTAANLLNDCFDHRRGLDSQVLPTSGAVVRGWITEAQSFWAAVALLVVGVLCGLFLTWRAGWVVLLLGALGSLFAVGYTTPRLCFKYVGLGDVAVFFSFGILTVFGAFWVQAREFHWLPVLWSLPISMLTVGIVHANNWRDLAGDPGKGCRTLASVLGSNGSRRYYGVLVVGPFALVALYAGLGLFASLKLPTPAAVLISFLALPQALRLAGTRPLKDPSTFAMLDGKTAQLHLLFSVLCTAAFWTTRFLSTVR